MLLKCSALVVVSYLHFVPSSFAEEQNETYTAAVIEVTARKLLIPPEFAFYLNIEQYAMLTNYLMKNAHKKPDLIVFPETGLQGDNDPFPIEIPRPEEHVVACFNDKYPLGLKTLSCMALDAHVYIVVNLAESYFNSTLNKTNVYSTTIAFDRGGELIAKYRKFNSLTEGVDSPNKVDYSFFLTDFGVTFGILAGEDLLFKEPAHGLTRGYKIRHFVHPSKWYSELPFLTAIQTQAAWSYAKNCVLISAGYNDPEKGNSGSGIYKGQQGPLEYSMSEKSESFALVAELPKDTHMAPFHINLMANKTAPTLTKYELDEVSNQPSLRAEMSLEKMEERLSSIHENAKNKLKPPSDSLKLLRDGIEKFSTFLIKPTILDQEANFTSNSTRLEGVAVVNETLCQGGFCCSFLVMMTTNYTRADKVANLSESEVRGDEFAKFRYRLAVFNGRRNLGIGLNSRKAAFQICGIIPCLNDSVGSCAQRTDNANGDFKASRNPLRLFHNGVAYIKTGTLFNSVVIKTEVSGNDSTIFPNILLGSGEDEDFGSLLSPKLFSFSKKEMVERGVQKQLLKLSIHDEVSNLASASIYARVYHLDNGKSSASQMSLLSLRVFSISSIVLTLFFK